MELSEAIHGRRSVRSFLPEPVERAALLEMLDAARMAPSGGNLQPWHFVVVEDREVIAGLEAAIREGIEDPPARVSGWRDDAWCVSNLVPRLREFSLFFAQAPALVAALYRHNPYNEAFLRSLTSRGMSLHEAHGYMGFTEVQSVAAAIQNFLLTAHALGYGACWMSVPFVAKDALKARLGVQAPWDLLALIPVGRPTQPNSSRRASRKGLAEVTTFLQGKAGT